MLTSSQGLTPDVDCPEALMRPYESAQEPKERLTVRGGGYTEVFTKYGTVYQPRLVRSLRKCVDAP